MRNPHFLESINTNSADFAYFAGFIYADGSKDKRGIRIKIAHSDKSVIEKMLDFFNLSPDRIRFKKRPDLFSGKYQCQDQVILNICNKEYSELLEKNFGIIKNKTVNFKEPIVSKEMFLPYLIGVIDGDGHIYGGFQGISIYTNIKFLEWAKQFLEKEFQILSTLKARGSIGILYIPYQHALELAKYVDNNLKQTVLRRKWDRIDLVKLSPRKYFTAEDKQAMAKMYETVGLEAIAQKFEISTMTVRKTIVSIGSKIRMPNKTIAKGAQ